MAGGLEQTTTRRKSNGHGKGSGTRHANSFNGEQLVSHPVWCHLQPMDTALKVGRNTGIQNRINSAKTKRNPTGGRTRLVAHQGKTVTPGDTASTHMGETGQTKTQDKEEIEGQTTVDPFYGVYTPNRKKQEDTETT